MENKELDKPQNERLDALFERISAIIEQSRKIVFTTVNVAEVKTRFEVGRYIFEDEQQGERATYGKQILKNLSIRLIERFGNDWSYDTLKRCRFFYQAYEHAEIGATPLPQLENNNQLIEYDKNTNYGNDVAPIRLPRFTLSWSHYTLPKDANIYASQYSLYLPDKTLLQAKLKQWIDEFNEANTKD